MNARVFFAAMDQSQDLPLEVRLDDGTTVRKDFHLTEFKNNTIESVDCGGARNEWRELVIQLWEPPLVEDHLLTTNTVMGIVNKVQQSLPLFMDAELKVEYSKPDGVLGVYTVADVSTAGGKLLVHLAKEEGQCKGLSSGACQPQKQKVAMADLGQASNGCTPGGGCC